MTITVQGNLDINGASGNTVTWTNVDLDFDGGGGTYDADWCVVSGSTVTDGPVDATDNCTDNGGNTGWTFSGAGVIEASLLLSGQYASSPSASAVFEVSSNLGVEAAAGPAGNGDFQSSINLAAELTAAFAGGVDLDVAVTFGSQSDLLLTGQVTTGPQTIEASLSLGLVQDISQLTVANLFTATSLGSTLQLVTAGGSDVEAALALAFQDGITTAVEISIEGGIALGVEAAMASAVQASLNAGVTLSHQAALQLVAGSVLEAGLSLGAIQSIQIDGFILVVGIETPDGRTISVRSIDRTITVRS